MESDGAAIASVSPQDEKRPANDGARWVPPHAVSVLFWVGGLKWGVACHRSALRWSPYPSTVSPIGCSPPRWIHPVRPRTPHDATEPALDRPRRARARGTGVRYSSTGREIHQSHSSGLVAGHVGIHHGTNLARPGCLAASSPPTGCPSWALCSSQSTPLDYRARLWIAISHRPHQALDRVARRVQETQPAFGLGCLRASVPLPALRCAAASKTPHATRPASTQESRLCSLSPVRASTRSSAARSGITYLPSYYILPAAFHCFVPPSLAVASQH